MWLPGTVTLASGQIINRPARRAYRNNVRRTVVSSLTPALVVWPAFNILFASRLTKASAGQVGSRRSHHCPMIVSLVNVNHSTAAETTRGRRGSGRYVDCYHAFDLTDRRMRRAHRLLGTCNCAAAHTWGGAPPPVSPILRMLVHIHADAPTHVARSGYAERQPGIEKGMSLFLNECFEELLNPGQAVHSKGRRTGYHRVCISICVVFVRNTSATPNLLPVPDLEVFRIVDTCSLNLKTGNPLWGMTGT